MALCLLAGGCAAPENATTGIEQPAGHRRMLELLSQIDERASEEHYFFESRTARDLREHLTRLGDAAPWRQHLMSGIAELNLGNERLGIAQLTRARELTRRPGSDIDQPTRSQVSFYLGVGWLRLGETENCLARRAARSCILPIVEDGEHAREEGSREAIRYFREVLEESGRGSYGYLSALWLFNLAYMTLGDYPDEVPEPYRIPPRAFEPETPFPRFDNVSAGLGLDTFGLAGGVIVDDFDGDDYLDIVTSDWDTSGQLRYFRNEGDGTFVERTEAAGLSGLYGGLNLVQADYDNDGDVDLLVLRGAWLFDGGRHPNSLLRNNGDGTFTDVTFEAGLGRTHYPTQTATWLDYDNDGDLDLYVGNEKTGEAAIANELFRNEGDGTFVDVAASAGVLNLAFAKAVVQGDFDGDRFPDLYVSNNGGPNRLYRNLGDGTFRDVAPERAVIGPRDSFPAWVWDFDNDGALDLYVSVYNAGIGELAGHALGLPASYELPRLYRGDGRGEFQDVALVQGLAYPAKPMGANFGDVDNDGYLDFYLGTGDENYFSLMPNVLFLNRRGAGFTDVTMAGGVGHLQKGHAVAFADLDNDGDQEIVAEMGGAYPGDKFANALFENPGFGNHWITVHLVGRESNRSAIGARIRVGVIEAGEPRSIYRHVSSGGSFGAGPLRQTIGLGRADRIETVELFWPTTNRTQIVAGVEMDRTIRIVEGRDGFMELALDRFTLRR